MSLGRAATIVGAVGVSGCSSTGSADGKRSMNNTEKGAIIGAVGSGLAGAAVGKYMDRLADVVVRYPKTAITVVGHTDAEGTSESNRDLSQRRAQAVVDYLESKNVISGRLTAVGRGETEPVADNKTDACRRANRRVELAVAPVRAD
jgi:hypothetical protein